MKYMYAICQDNLWSKITNFNYSNILKNIINSVSLLNIIFGTCYKNYIIWNDNYTNNDSKILILFLKCIIKVIF